MVIIKLDYQETAHDMSYHVSRQLFSSRDREQEYSRYEKGERDFFGIDLSGAVLSITYVSNYDPTQNILSGTALPAITQYSFSPYLSPTHSFQL